MTTAAPGTRIRYMGNKVALAQDVSAIVETVEPNRVLVDLFGGMCSVAGAVSRSGRHVWNNDIQHYAHLVARCLLTSKVAPPSRDKAVRVLTSSYRFNLTALRARFEEDLRIEREVLSRGSTSLYRETQGSWKHAGNDRAIGQEVARLRRRPSGPYRLATLTFAWGYFGLRQSIEIDSVRAAIDAADADQTLSSDEAAWCRLALLQSCSRVASTPGHFAQFLRGEQPSSLRRILAARRRSVWDAVLDDLQHLSPFGNRKWRAGNRVLIADALTIWRELDDARLGPAVFYMDPPYSKEQYSRFYHVLETLALYDYPDSSGAGRYRPDRFATPLATKSGVLAATRTLLSAIAERDGILLLSYPSTGLLTSGLGIDMDALLGEYFAKVRLAIDIPSRHSTLGGRHGASRHEVLEYVWVAS
ncbi:MAG TPA: DNA adenine methylase [Solirubrobacteraceae bacterium]|jgi:adenine-specific DNA-methyltransferase|nr:DNA adenine methylase [Solirubrobacteraceae bacterium]